MLRIALIQILVLLLTTACTPTGELDAGKALNLGAGALQASLLDEASVKEAATLAAGELDKQSQLAGAANPYTARLAKITAGLQGYDGLQLNFKVYLTKEVNAFAMADGTVRVHSALLDAMPDDQVLAVIGHEIGHVRLKHSYRQMREALLTNVAFDAAASVGGVIGSLTASQLGTLAHAAVNAHFSQTDELEADAFAVRVLKDLNRDPYAMKRAIETLTTIGGPGGGFLSSHPSNKQRLDTIQAQINKL